MILFMRNTHSHRDEKGWVYRTDIKDEDLRACDERGANLVCHILVSGKWMSLEDVYEEIVKYWEDDPDQRIDQYTIGDVLIDLGTLLKHGLARCKYSNGLKNMSKPIQSGLC
jgi:hypothetical protein